MHDLDITKYPYVSLAEALHRILNMKHPEKVKPYQLHQDIQEIK